MANNITTWSTTASTNTVLDGINWPEGQTAASVNNSARQMMASLKAWYLDTAGSVVATGTANAITITTNVGFTALADGRWFAFKASADNTGATTLNANTLGAKSVRKMTLNGDEPLEGGEIQDDGIYIVHYSADANAAAGGWILANPTRISRAPFTISEYTTTASSIAIPTGATHCRIEACGGGGGGGGCGAPSASQASAGAGGGSGAFGETNVISLSGLTTFDVTIGAGGAANSGASGGDGGDTTATFGVTTYTFPGGGGGMAGGASTAVSLLSGGFGGAYGTNVKTGSNSGHAGVGGGTGGAVAIGGAGGGSPYGLPGGYRRMTSGSVAGLAGTGNGQGGGGAAGYNSGTAQAGGAGASGIVRVTWYYGGL